MGVCLALEMAEAGHHVQLFEAADTILKKASFVNEGKIHLGFVYAKDDTGKTAERMVTGALTFRHHVSKWVESNVFDAALSEPFHYAVPLNSMLTKEKIHAHFNKVQHLYDIQKQKGGQYLGPAENQIFRELGLSEWRDICNEDEIVTVFSTEERSVDPMVIANSLRHAIKSHPSITLHEGTPVESCKMANKDSVKVAFIKEGIKQSISFSLVANTSWQNRLSLDKTAGIAEQRDVMHRYKVALHSKGEITAGKIPSITFLVGSYGDIVQFSERIYLNWYPAGLVYSETTPHPAAEHEILQHVFPDRLYKDTIEPLAYLVPQMQRFLNGNPEKWDVLGGFISAWGHSGIDDPQSMLHRRYDVGCQQFGNYFSIDTGKYTLAPSIAVDTARRMSQS